MRREGGGDIGALQVNSHPCISTRISLVLRPNLHVGGGGGASSAEGVARCGVMTALPFPPIIS